MKTEYLIIGQGIAGTSLAEAFVNSEVDFFVLDIFKERTSSLIAAGIMNPITGKRMLKTWLADDLFPFAQKYYTALEKKLGEKFYFPRNVIRAFSSAHQANEWDVQQADPDFKDYIINDYKFEQISKFNFHHGYTIITKAANVNTIKYLKAYRNWLLSEKCIRKTEFQFEKLVIKKQKVIYEDIEANNIIFCEGWTGFRNPYFSKLQFLPSKGELLTIHCPDLAIDEIINSGIFMLPVGGNLYVVGSTYTWNDFTEKPTQNRKMELSKKLNKILKSDYKIVDHQAGIRPSVQSRRPFIGRHPKFPNILIFNGMGTKGLSLAPYFAEHFVKHLLHKEALNNEVNIQQYENLLK